MHLPRWFFSHFPTTTTTTKKKVQPLNDKYIIDTFCGIKSLWYSFISNFHPSIHFLYQWECISSVNGWKSCLVKSLECIWRKGTTPKKWSKMGTDILCWWHQLHKCQLSNPKSFMYTLAENPKKCKTPIEVLQTWSLTTWLVHYFDSNDAV